MELEEALLNYLLDKTALTALIGARLSADEILPGTNMPAVMFSKISDVKSHLYTGQNSFERPIFQFSVFALTKPSARAVANQLKAALSDYKGIMNGIEIQKIELQNEMSMLEKSSEGAYKTYIEILEYEINFIRR